VCPGYREIYINVAGTREDARRHRTAVEDWHENAYAVIRLADYEAASERTRPEVVFEALLDGLRELAKIDHLDANLIERAGQQIRASGLETDIEYRRAENAKFAARILYRVAADGGDPFFRLEVTEKGSARKAAVDLGRHDLWWLPYRFGKLVLKPKEVVIEARKGERPQVYLDSHKLPSKLSFRFAKLFEADETV
jgi:hypothetical protein